jgi:membrane protease YdiL (CAAX protease family)
MLAIIIALSQGISYLLPGLVAARTLYPSDWLDELSLAKFPAIHKLLMGLVAFSLTLGLTGVLAAINANVDLPEWAQAIEGDVAGVLETLITGSSWPQFLAVILVIGVLPALGEEIVFRGLLQPAFIRSSGSAHLGVWLTAVLFGLVHMQFAGMLPRIFLGAVLGFLAYCSQRLWIPVLAHFLFNSLQAVAVRFQWLDVEQAAAQAQEAPTTVQVLAAILVSAAALWFFLPRIAPDELAAPPAMPDIEKEQDQDPSA